MLEPLILGEATRVMSLRDGTKKMSKSDPSDMSRITMTDDADAIAKKVRKATSDPNLIPGPEVLDEVGLVDPGDNPERWSLMADYSFSEFSRIRLQYNHDDSRGGPSDEQVTLQYIMSLGAHGAHEF